jgi:hypothetical protein
VNHEHFESDEIRKGNAVMAITKFLVGIATLSLVGCGSSSAGNGAKEDASPAHDAGGITLLLPDATAKPDANEAHDATPDEAAPGCTYPAGPYGVAVGSVLSPTLEWAGYAPGATASSTLKTTNIYDCDGKKGINAIVVLSSAQWCVACQQEAEFIPSWLGSTGPIAANWDALGVEVLTLVIQTNQNEPATLATAAQWRTENDVTDVWVVADPGDTFPSDTLPHDLLIDPRTMKVVDNLDNDNYDAAPPASDPTGEAADPAIAALATKNKTQN